MLVVMAAIEQDTATGGGVLQLVLVAVTGWRSDLAAQEYFYFFMSIFSRTPC